MAEMYKTIGSRPARLDGIDKVTGQARFAPDIQLPGMIYGKILRSPHAHARILEIDTRAAENMDGVLAVATSSDLGAAEDRTERLGEGSVNYKYMCDNTFASDKVLYMGHAVAAVAATTMTIAEQAAKQIKVTYEVLPAVVDVLEAMKENAPLLHEHMHTQSLAGESKKPSNVSSHMQSSCGDIELGFSQADVVVEREFRSHTVHPGYLEPNAATAIWRQDGTLTVYTTTQGAFAVRDQLAQLLHLPQSRIRVIPTEVGGAFGGKNTSFVDTAAALLSYKSGGRPVRIVMTMAEVLMATGPSSGGVIRIKVGATIEGKITAAQAELFYEAGAYPGSPVGSGMNVMFAPYIIPNGQLDGYDIVVNRPKIGSYRAPGATPANFAVESVLDEIAREINLDPIELRMLNYGPEGSRTIQGGTRGSIGGMEVLKAAQASQHYHAPLESENRGRGIALAYWGNWGARSSCLITVHSDGTLSLVTGSVDLSGTRTSLAMQAAEALELPLSLLSAHVGDTNNTGYSDVSAGSRTTMATGIAAVKAAHDVVRQMSERAAQIWDIPGDQVSYSAGIFNQRDHPDEQLTFAEVASELSQTGGYITGVGNVNVDAWGAAYGVHIADVEVDPETGLVTLLRYTAVQDAGKAIHPTLVEGQMQGGAVQGIGWALYEGYMYNQDGHLLNPSLLDYKLPTILDIPEIETIIVEV
ncbi:MAG: xanthine dehydrogenase family protein molybdopterin-binding subunit, partial [Anaerolineae bacterium]|nr:xanthine dehydrogenase family protein molybdopterin-binding subunit [Anaerolineae bacterium]